jgi:hypothetical protein
MQWWMAALLAGVLAGPLAAPAGAVLKVKWATRLGKCEPPNVFYSAQHRLGAKPCCASIVGVCPGGESCPPGGVCSDGSACTPGTQPNRPNVVLMISDDQAACHYGHAGECRSVNTGTPIPAPSTPNLDLLAGHGTVFPVAHNTAAWCFPSLTSILTGRYQKSMANQSRVADAFGTIAKSLRNLDGVPGLQADPFNAGNRVGGYCTLLGGKFIGSIGDAGFDARARTGERLLGRTTCVAGAPGQPPRCGSEAQTDYSPSDVFRLGDVFDFLDSLRFRVPDVAPARYDMQKFFMWYAPRIPHQPLRSPVPVREYLFGSGASYPLGGLFQLGGLCSGFGCSPSVAAFNEVNFGDEHEMYANVWWLDDGVRELRKYFAKASAPHCIGPDGRSRFDVPSPGLCPGTWVSDFAYDLARDTVIVMLSDNGWFLPHSKHQFTENGHRTRMIVFDPRTLPAVPGWDGTQEVIPPPNESPALAHAVDAFTTIMGYATDSAPGTQLCPQAPFDGSRCDGRDLRAHLANAPGGPAPAATLRHSLCGHETEKSTTPTLDRYLVTRPGSVGRCTVLTAPSCSSSADCGAGAFCLGGRCLATAEPSCTSTSQCATGAVCLGGRCRVAPACTDDGDCAALLNGTPSACVAKEMKWCRNAPGVACATNADCPACADGGACGRVCEARQLKFYVAPGASGTAHQVTDLFLDPDENGLHEGISSGRSLVSDISSLGGPYGDALRRAACCLDQWWSTPTMGASICGPGYSCPADFTCNQ